jgi:hypothetical protein
MSGVTYTSQRMAPTPLAARAHVPAIACVPANAPGNGLLIDRPWDRGNSGFTAKRHPRHLGSSPT